MTSSKIRCGSSGKSIYEGIPGQCVDTNDWYDKKIYDCLDRSDGVPFDTDLYFDWSNVTLKECKIDHEYNVEKGKFLLPRPGQCF